ARPALTAVTPSTHPLVAQYSIQHFQAGLNGWVEFGTDTSYGRRTSVVTDSVTTPAGEVINILVAGMKPQTTYHMRAHVDWAVGSWVDQDHTFTTGALPTSQPLPQLRITPPVPGFKPAPGVELLNVLSQSNPNMLQAVVIDLQGNPIWYCPQRTIPIKPLPNGHFILNTGTDLLEVDLNCKTIRDVSAAQVNRSLQANGYSFTISPSLGLPGGSQF